MRADRSRTIGYQADDQLVPSHADGSFGRANLCLLLGDLDTHVFAHDETGDALVPGGWIDIRKHLTRSVALLFKVDEYERTRKVSASAEFEIQLPQSASCHLCKEDRRLRLGTVEDVVAVRVLLSCGLERERIGTSGVFREAERPDLLSQLSLR